MPELIKAVLPDKPWSSKERVNRAGAAFRRGEAADDDFEVINKWRASHNPVLNAFQANLRARVRNKNIIFAQRLKRLPTILGKLHREPGMNLARMDDVAGCRLIFADVEELREFRSKFHA